MGHSVHQPAGDCTLYGRTVCQHTVSRLQVVLPTGVEPCAASTAQPYLGGSHSLAIVQPWLAWKGQPTYLCSLLLSAGVTDSLVNKNPIITLEYAKIQFETDRSVLK